MVEKSYAQGASYLDTLRTAVYLVWDQPVVIWDLLLRDLQQFLNNNYVTSTLNKSIRSLRSSIARPWKRSCSTVNPIWVTSRVISVEALSSAVCYAAVISMTENQCQTMFRADKSDIVTYYRVACERAFEQAGLITTNEITVLQAFVLYLVSLVGSSLTMYRYFLNVQIYRNL